MQMSVAVAHHQLTIGDLMLETDNAGRLREGADGGLATSRERAMCHFSLTRGMSPASKWLAATQT
jgi:hypothetical protein